MPEQATSRLELTSLDGQGVCDPLAAETSPHMGRGRAEHVPEEDGEVVEDGEDAGDAADAAQKAGREVAGDSLRWVSVSWSSSVSAQRAADAEGSGDPPTTEGTSVTSAEPMCPQCALVA
jgi:hypothetical protein